MIVSTTFTAAYGKPFLALFRCLCSGAWRNPWVFVVFGVDGDRQRYGRLPVGRSVW